LDQRISIEDWDRFFDTIQGDYRDRSMVLVIAKYCQQFQKRGWIEFCIMLKLKATLIHTNRNLISTFFSTMKGQGEAKNIGVKQI
jgi:hypothetical protein